jgi:hypothetical protein
MDEREGGLLAWQWRLYPDGHRDRANLAIHLATVPLFWLGTLQTLFTPVFWLWGAPLWSPALGLGAMVVAMALQGRGHKREATRPVPFRGPLDVVRRFFCEQWVTFPRYLLSGKLSRAWRGPDPRADG